MLAFADMVHLFAHEFAGLGARRFAGSLVASCSRDRRLLRHTASVASGATRVPTL
jgi:hypothetical protein